MLGHILAQRVDPDADPSARVVKSESSLHRGGRKLRTVVASPTESDVGGSVHGRRFSGFEDTTQSLVGWVFSGIKLPETQGELVPEPRHIQTADEAIVACYWTGRIVTGIGYSPPGAGDAAVLDAVGCPQRFCGILRPCKCPACLVDYDDGLKRLSLSWLSGRRLWIWLQSPEGSEGFQCRRKAGKAPLPRM